MMEGDSKSSHTTEEQSLKCTLSADKEKRPSEVFVNHAAIAWHENRRKWIGDRSRRSKRGPKEPVISWSMAYEDLLLTNEPFKESIPLPGGLWDAK
ncbi:hypothetical protein Ancab_023580 [Ancistrocladus abbreviatus]